MSTLSISDVLTSKVLEANHRGALQKISKTFTMKTFVTSTTAALGFGLAATALPLPSSAEASQPTDALVQSLQYHAARRERKEAHAGAQ